MIHTHNYMPVKTTPDGITEVCTECKKRLYTKLDSKGRADNRTYMREHVRDTAQPRGATSKIFAKAYGQGGT